MADGFARSLQRRKPPGKGCYLWGLVGLERAFGLCWLFAGSCFFGVSAYLGIFHIAMEHAKPGINQKLIVCRIKSDKQRWYIGVFGVMLFWFKYHIPICQQLLQNREKHLCWSWHRICLRAGLRHPCSLVCCVCAHVHMDEHVCVPAHVYLCTLMGRGLDSRTRQQLELWKTQRGMWLVDQWVATCSSIRTLQHKQCCKDSHMNLSFWQF